jgi:hypothetical protein
MNPASIFDRSPSEKLQLVEGLWDDLAVEVVDPQCTLPYTLS